MNRRLPNQKPERRSTAQDAGAGSGAEDKEAAEANEKYLRTYADFDNYRKRMQRDMAEFRKYANEQLVLELLTVVDNLGLALKHATEAGEAVQGMQQGVELVYKQLRDMLEKFGVKKFSRRGRAFRSGKA